MTITFTEHGTPNSSITDALRNAPEHTKMSGGNEFVIHVRNSKVTPVQLKINTIGLSALLYATDILESHNYKDAYLKKDHPVKGVDCLFIKK